MAGQALKEAQTDKSGWIDVSVPLYSGMVRWPGDPEVRVERIVDMAKGEPCNVTEISCSAHVGTHVDAPLHFVRDGAGIDALPLELAIGSVRVIEIDTAQPIGPEQLRPSSINSGERILLKTSNSLRCWKQSSFCTEYACLSAAGAAFLVEQGVRLVGIDYLSIGAYEQDGEQTHRLLLQAGIWVIEGLDLRQVLAGSYEMVCLPLRLRGAEGAPARVLLKPQEPPRK